MNIYTLPDPSDIKDTIADCLDALKIAPVEQHGRIAEDCVAPVTLLFLASEMAGCAGREEQAVFAYFLALMAAQAGGSAEP
jgi:hypothetical protein